MQVQQKMFKSSIAGQIDPEFTARATFWKGETEYILADYNAAALSYNKQFLSLPKASATQSIKQ
jgi:TolA-binding protein